MGWKVHQEACETAHRAVQAALQVDPRSADAFAIRAELRVVYDWDWAGAEADVRQAEAFGGGEDTQFAAARLTYATGQMNRARQLLDSIWLKGDPLMRSMATDERYEAFLRKMHLPEH